MGKRKSHVIGPVSTPVWEHVFTIWQHRWFGKRHATQCKYCLETLGGPEVPTWRVLQHFAGGHCKESPANVHHELALSQRPRSQCAPSPPSARDEERASDVVALAAEGGGEAHRGCEGSDALNEHHEEEEIGDSERSESSDSDARGAREVLPHP
jgi:hypothetical protein